MLHVFINNDNDPFNNTGCKMSTKYLKFGLRADKNLSDLTNADSALSNVLDNVSAALDENGLASGFSVDDISATRGLRNTGLADNVNADGQSTDLAGLNDSLVQFTVGIGTSLSSTPGTVLEIQPRRTIQDNISNFKSILGNPPWLDGGDGPIARFVSSDRIRSVAPSATTTGGSADVAIASLGTNLFSTSIAHDYIDMIYPVDFWNDGVFEFAAKLHPSLPNTYGLVQWTGYLSASTSQLWDSTGLFIIEEDVLDASGADNYTPIKSIYANSVAHAGLSMTNDGTNTTIDLSSATAGGVAIGATYVSKGMIIGGDATKVVDTIDLVGESCVVTGVVTGTTATFSFTIGETLVETPIVFTPQKRGNRLKVRYTVWYPDPGNGSNYRTKRFGETSDNSERLPFNKLYSTFDRNQVFGPYTHKYFEDNKASPLNQTSTFPIRVNATLSAPYTPPTLISAKLATVSGNVSTVTMKTATMVDTFGKLEASNWTDCTVGDWIIFEKGTNSYYTYQISEISGVFAYVADTIDTDATISVGGTISVMIWKNEGLLGLYRLDTSQTTSGAIHKILAESVSPNRVYPDHLLLGMEPNGTSGTQAMRVSASTIVNANRNNIVVEAYNGNGAALNSGNSIVAIYASRGLEDKSVVLQCGGVYGKEVASTSSAGSNTVTLTSVAGISNGHYVQYAGAIATGVTVTAVNTGTKTITLSSTISAPLNAAATLVFVSSNPGSVNKEFCIIPLNTAPPFAGTALGLATPSSKANLEVEGLSFGSLQLTVPSANVNAVGSVSTAAKYFPISYGATNYKLLIKD